MENSIERTMNTAWQKSKWIVKGCIIGVLALIMMIPMLYVKELIFEREERQEEATREITGKWAGIQNLVGPVIGIPYFKKDDADTSSKKPLNKHIAYFLPQSLVIDANVNPKEKHRGIFKVMLYDAKIKFSGNFNGLDITKLKIPAEQFLWNEAFISIHLADYKGLNDQVNIKWKDSILELSPDPERGSDVITALLKTTSPEDFINASFSSNIDINGSEQLLFTPVGKSTIVTVNSSWQHPSFAGSTLPQTTEINDSGFKAVWKSMAHKRGFAQQWIDNDISFDHFNPPPPELTEGRYGKTTVTSKPEAVSPSSIANTAFGVDLFIPVNGYQKILRTIKYALLCIVLTFAAFFLIETSNKKSAHPFQYGLIGLALILFYTLLLSVSEYTGFNSAYMISSVATIGLIAWFVKSILQSGRATTILSVVLVLVYSYIFSLLQLQDYSLLLGSIGLFLTLAVVMYFSKKMQW